MNLTNKQIEDLYHTGAAGWLYKDQFNRFEIHDGKEAKNLDFYKKGSMLFYESQLEACFAFNYYSKKYPNTLMLWDMSNSDYCVLSKRPFL